jgi:hypothetical protein
MVVFGVNYPVTTPEQLNLRQSNHLAQQIGGGKAHIVLASNIIPCVTA